MVTRVRSVSDDVTTGYQNPEWCPEDPAMVDALSRARY
jgi:hypothetical protein